MSQRVSSFSSIMRKESNIEVKNHMHDNLANLMEDSFDFGLNDAETCHTVLSFKNGKKKNLIGVTQM